MNNLRRIGTRLLRAANGNDRKLVVYSYRGDALNTPTSNELVLLSPGNYQPYIWDITADIEALQAHRAESAEQAEQNR